MTQIKLTKNECIEKKYEDEEKSTMEKSIPQCISDNCIQICAWVLLTLGLCIIVTTLYLSIVQQQNQSETYPNKSNVPYVNDVQNFNVFLDVNEGGRTIVEDLYTITNTSLSGCWEKYCKIVCLRAEDLYTTLYETLIVSSCLQTDILYIKHQNFPKGIISNSWLELDRPLYELLLSESNVTVIRNNAFNADIFSSTFLLSWHKLALKKVESGALLGLHSLKYLIIETSIEQLDRAFFQPVQTTLTHLKLNAGLKITSNQNVFGISNLLQLEYADLSENYFVGPITKKTFAAAPNLKYLRIVNAKITYIEKDAFTNLIDKLTVLNLSDNYLSFLSGDVIEPLMASSSKTFMSLSSNNWNCSCELYSLACLYTKYRSQFMDTIYCKAPHYLYGTFVNDVDFAAEGCTISSTTPVFGSTTTAIPYTGDSDRYSSEEIIISNDTVFHLRCLNAIGNNISDSPSKSLESSLSSSSASSSSSSSSSDSTDASSGIYAPADKRKLISIIKRETLNTGESSEDKLGFKLEKRNQEIFQLQPRTHEMELKLLENRSVQVTVLNELGNSINIIWFNGECTASSFADYTDAGKPLGYKCSSYKGPYLISDPLKENTTYTFCLVIKDYPTIPPLNCLPLYVPLSATYDDTWILKNDRPFTIGMLCFIFLLSVFLGAIVAYFGIKSYPDLLEGSKNVLVVKKSEQTCYVSTISEAEYLKNTTSFKKKPLKKNSLKPPPEPPTSVNQQPNFNISARHLERLSSLKSSSTTFEDSFVSMTFPDDEYETPKNYVQHNIYAESCIPNTYAMSPCSPPPLPKRNPSQVDNN